MLSYNKTPFSPVIENVFILTLYAYSSHLSQDGREQSIYLNGAKCYPQAYVAAITIFNELVGYTKVLIVDIGGFTADYLLMREGEPDLSVCNSLENGIIILYNQIRERVNAEFDMLLDEADVDAILEGKETVYGKEIVDMVLAIRFCRGSV